MDREYTASKSRIVAVILAFLSVGILFGLALFSPGSILLDLHFNAYAVPSAVTLLVCLGLLFSLIRTPARTEERVWLTVYFGGLAMYTFGEVMQRLSVSPATALFWLHIRDPATIIAPALYLFTLSYTNRTERRYPGTIVALTIAAFISTIFYTLTNFLYINAPAAMHSNPWGYTPQLVNGGLVSTLLLIDGMLVLALVTLINFRRHTRNEILRKQSLIFILALSINIIVPTFTDAVLPALGVPIPPLGVTLSTVTGAILIFGLLRYQLLTINPTLFSNTILSIMQEAVVVTDKRFQIIYLNPTAELLLGTAASRNNVSLLKFIDPDYAATFQKAFTDKAASTSAIEIEEIDIKHPHTDAVPVRLNSTALQVGNYETRIMVLTNIAKELQTRGVIEHEVRVRTEQLHRARAYLISSINSLEQGFVLVNHDAKVEMVNGMASHLFATHNDDAVNKPFAELVEHMHWNIDLSKAVQKVLDAKRHKKLNAEAEDGTFYTVYVTPILSGERELGVTIIIEDITEQKILDRSKDEFFSIASHELRTPLTAIRGNMSMIKQYFPNVVKDDSVATMINDTYGASTRLIEIVNDFMDSSSLEQGKMQFSIQPLDPLPLMQNVIQELQSLASAQHNTFVFDSKRLPKIMADEGRVKQIFYNVLSNGAKYTNDGHVTITADHDEHSLTIHVADTGKGISPENQKLLFHKFQQAGDSILTRDNTKGTGLGLYIARLLATNMHGNVELERTEVGKGTVFKITLPLAKS